MCDMALAWQKEQREEWERSHGPKKVIDDLDKATEGQAEELAKLIKKLEETPPDQNPDVENEAEQHMPGQDDQHANHNRKPTPEEEEETPDTDEGEGEAEVEQTVQPTATPVVTRAEKRKAAATYVPAHAPRKN